MSESAPARPPVLIEHWLPIAEIGAESQRERGASSALPPLYFLHVWWARRPLLTSRAAVLGSVLPAWSPDWPSRLREQFPTDESYRHWFMRLLGILGDPVAGRKLIQNAKERGIKLPGNPYGYPRAFTVSPDQSQIRILHDLLKYTWGTHDISVMDPMAGGGSIPFEGLRYGFSVYGNELNPVATLILKATLEYPVQFGPRLLEDFQRYGNLLAERVHKRLEQFFPINGGESIRAYIWARTVECPYTGKPIPLSPNWWLQKASDPVAVRPVFDPKATEARFEIVRGRRPCERAKPDYGTVRRGDAISPWAQNQPVENRTIKTAAEQGRMGEQLVAIATKRSGAVHFRGPTQEDQSGLRAAAMELERQTPQWEAREWLPAVLLPLDTESWTHGNTPAQYGARSFADLFSPRQLLTLCTFLESFHEVKERIFTELPGERARAVATYLAFALDKCADYNSRMTRWHSGRGVIAGTFDRHEFSFKWSHAEFDGSRNLLPWALDQVEDAYLGITQLVAPVEDIFPQGTRKAPVSITRGNASALSNIPDASMQSICVDPPYYDNVMYGECSDFFYVWIRRALQTTYPELLIEELTNKDDEVVANLGRFAGIGYRRRELALADYERKMAAAFREMHRILRGDGVLTVMFTHKKVEAWDTLATSLIGAGFAIHASWPVHTESEHSLHQAKKNAAASTILLVCRKREPAKDSVWWDDLKSKVRETARAKAEEFEKQGIRGVDLYISTFGPTLSIISEHWPVLTGDVDPKTGQPKPLRPDVALDLARQEVVDLRKRDLLLGRTVQFDRATDWYLMAWDAFQAEQFPADEARKLAIALDINLEEVLIKTKRIISKKQNFVVLQPPTARRKKGMVDPELTTFDSQLDAVHTAMLVLEEDGSRACERFLRQARLLNDGTFKACLQALINAVPRAKKKGKFVRPEAALLDRLRDAFFQDLEVPPEEAPPALPAQQAFGFAKAAEDVAEYEESEEEAEEAEEE